MNDLGANRALILVRLKRRLAVGAKKPLRLDHGRAAEMAFQLQTELFMDPDGLQVLAQRKAPVGQQAGRVHQVQMPHARMVMVMQGQTGPIIPCLPAGVAMGATEQATVGHGQQPADKTKLGVEVNLQHGQNVFSRLKQ